MNILIIKTGAAGDVLRTSFIAKALKDKYIKKNPKITWITAKFSFPLLQNNPYIDEIIEEKNNSSLNKKFDLVVNLEEDEENAKLTSKLKQKKVYGFYWKQNKIIPSETAKEWFDMSILGKKPENDILKKKNKKTHRQIISEICGIRNYEKYEPFIKLTLNQEKVAQEFMNKHSLSRSDLIIGINSGSAGRWPKHLPIKKTIDLIEKLNKKFKAKIILFGGPEEVCRNQEILKKIKTPIISAGCDNSLSDFIALVSVCNLIITTDTLALHISLALKRKTICLIGPTSSNELGMYDLGEKVIAKSPCLCCYKNDCKSMEKIDLNQVIQKTEQLVNLKISLIITAFKEPKTIAKAIESALNQKTKHNYEIIVSAPDKETLDIAREYEKKHKNITIFQDPGKGKSFALNLLFKKIKSEILILTDGDVFINDSSIENIYNLFLYPEIGCVTGQPIPIENKKTKYGYWANFLFNAAHKIRKHAFQKKSFIECSGYLFAFRKSQIKEIPLDVAEDTIIPYNFWNKGYKIGYAENAKVYVKNVTNWKDWINQKTRTSKAHETLAKYVNTKLTKRVKSFSNEARGIFHVLKYPENLIQFYWTVELIIARLYMWLIVFYDTKFKSKQYQDAWQRIESTK
jgi:heptosyltransferase-2